MDAADRAQEREQEHLAAALAARRGFRQAVAAGLNCADCGEPIPAARRAAVPGCQRCVECERAWERAA